MDFTNLTPIFGYGYKNIFLNGSLSVGIFNSLIILFFISPNVKDIKKTGIYSIIISSITIFLILLLLFTVFPHEALGQNSFAIFELTRIIGFRKIFSKTRINFLLIVDYCSMHISWRSTKIFD